MRSTHISLHSVSPASLEGNLPIFDDHFVRWHSTSVDKPLPPVDTVLYEGYMCDTISLRIFGVTVRL